jgi:glyoxylase-like metal-dependent hydrolase (beta-lactamase superfamily II)
MLDKIVGPFYTPFKGSSSALLAFRKEVSMGPKEIVRDIYLVGGSDITDPKDCSIYLLDLGELVLIDAGAGTSVNAIIHNIKELGLDPENLSTVILTHCHIDHTGGAHEFRKRFGARIVIHRLDATAVENGDKVLTGASWYGVNFAPLPVDVKLVKDEEFPCFGSQKVVCLHTPGHTPGSISLYLDKEGKRILFGQDIHGPFLAEFGANMSHWQKSMETLLTLNADILCEGHFGVYKPAHVVRQYIERYLDEYGE